MFVHTPKFSRVVLFFACTRYFELILMVINYTFLLLHVLTRSLLLVSLLLQCNDISVNPGPSIKITCPRCLKTVRRNQAFGFCVLCKSRFHLKCLDANFESGSTCHFCSVPSSAEQQFEYIPQVPGNRAKFAQNHHARKPVSATLSVLK